MRAKSLAKRLALASFSLQYNRIVHCGGDRLDIGAIDLRITSHLKVNSLLAITRTEFEDGFGAIWLPRRSGNVAVLACPVFIGTAAHMMIQTHLSVR